MQRKPSYFGSNDQPSPSGNVALAFANIGEPGRGTASAIGLLSTPSPLSGGERAHRVGERELVLLAGGAVTALDHPTGEALRADGDAHRHAEQIGVGELHAGARVAVVVEHRDSRRAQ